MAETQRWLREQAGSYEERERVVLDVERALADFPTLRPKSDMYSKFPLSNPFISDRNTQPTTMAVPSFSSVSTVYFPSHSGVLPTTSRLQSGSQKTTLAAPRSFM